MKVNTIKELTENTFVEFPNFWSYLKHTPIIETYEHIDWTKEWDNYSSQSRVPSPFIYNFNECCNQHGFVVLYHEHSYQNDIEHFVIKDCFNDCIITEELRSFVAHDYLEKLAASRNNSLKIVETPKIKTISHQKKLPSGETYDQT